jgi:hypothetical protein
VTFGGTASTPARQWGEPARDAWIVTDRGGAADVGAGVVESTSETPVGGRANRLTAYLLPLALAGALFAPTPLREVRRQYRSGSGTLVVDVTWDLDQDFFEPDLERISDDQVRALNALLAVPYTNDHGVAYLADE